MQIYIYITLSKILEVYRDSLFARLTPLGWTCVGPLNDAYQNGPKTHFTRTYFMSDQTAMEEVDTVLY